MLNNNSYVIVRALLHHKLMVYRALTICFLTFFSLPSISAICGEPQIDSNNVAAIYIWQECDTSVWHLRATGGGDYANFTGRLFTDGEITSAIPVWLGKADTFEVNEKGINFNLRIWLNNQDGIDFSVSDNSSVYLDITYATDDNFYLGSIAEPIQQFPARIGGTGRKLNYIFILSDDQRFDTLWAMPNVQNYLVNQGVLFENAVVSSPLCCPARASIISGGLFDKNTGVYSNNPTTGTFGLFDDSYNLGNALQDSGYRTALIGKVMNGYPTGYVLPGWSKLIANLGPARDDWNSFNVTVGSSGATSTAGLIIGPINEYITDYHTNESLAFISEASDKPFFLLLSSYAPHAPATPASVDVSLFQDFNYTGRGVSETDLSDKPIWVSDPTIAIIVKNPLTGFPAQQLRSLQALDRSVGAIVEKLIELNKIDNTVIVFTSDNGFMWGEHGIWRKTHEFEESIRVPLVIRYPGISPRTEVAQVAVDLDVPATVLDLAGSSFRTDGLSLIPLLHEQVSSHRERLLINMYDTVNVHRIWAGVRTNDWKYFENAYGDVQLYDLVSDPYELESKHNDANYADIQLTLKNYLDQMKGLAITKLAQPNLVVNEDFQFQLEAWGGKPPYSWKAENLFTKVFLGKERWVITDVHLPLPLKDNYSSCGAPSFSPDTERLFLIWNECNSDYWHVRSTAGGDYGKFSGNITADYEFISVVPYLLNDADYLALPEPNIIDFIMQIWNDNQDGIDFEVATDSAISLEVSKEPGHYIQLGKDRFDVTDSNLPKNISDPIHRGQPNFDSSVETAIFIWKDCVLDRWHLRGTAGGNYVKFEGTIISDIPLVNVTQYNLGDSDKLVTDDLTQVDFMMQIWGSNINGFDFSLAEGANVVIDIDTHNLPTGLVLNSVDGIISGTPERLARRTVRLTVEDQSVRKIDGKPQSISMDMKINVTK